MTGASTGPARRSKVMIAAFITFFAHELTLS
jgi:hypothetical protein